MQPEKKKPAKNRPGDRPDPGESGLVKVSDESEEEESPIHTDEDLKEWLLTNSFRGQAMMEVLGEAFKEQSGSIPPELREEMEGLLKTFGDQIAGTVVPHFLNPMADRLAEIMELDAFGAAEVEELKAMEKEMGRLQDMALDITEPARGRAMAVIAQDLEVVRKLLRYLESPAGQVMVLFKPLAKRFTEMLDLKGFGPAEVEELKEMEKEMDRLLARAQDIAEPDRGEVTAGIAQDLESVRKLLEVLESALGQTIVDRRRRRRRRKDGGGL